MKAMVYTRCGSPEDFRLREVANPTPEDNEVLIRVHASSINAWDWDLLRGRPYLTRIGGLRRPKFTIIGADVAGRVEAVGVDVEELSPGDEVFGDLSGSGWGGFAEYVCARERAVARKPANMTFEQAAGVWQASDNTGPPEDDRLHLAALSEQGATPPTTEQVLEGKPVPTASPGAEIVDLPDASECTVEPLTIDEVLAIVDDPQSQDGTLVNYTRVVMATPGATTGTEGPGYREIMAPPSQETLDEVAAVRREWVACTMANSWFQVWALSDPRIVYQDVTERLYPIYVTREDARVMLEELQANGTAGNLPLWSSEWVQLVDPDPARSVQIMEPMVEVALRTYDSEGRRVIYSDEDEERKSPASPNRPVGYVYFTLVWSELEQRWLVFRGDGHARD